ncbi:AhpD-like protein [Lentinula novae-zelandiae]|nr:AhpD-like protein [Lentinula novae-zelandiae]
MPFNTNATLLSHLKSIYPSTGISNASNPWYIVTAVAFSASNEPQAVPEVFNYALAEAGQEREERLLLARKFRDALFKAGLTSGYSKTINSLAALHEVMPPELRDTTMLRDKTTSIQDHEGNGRAFFRETYGDTADSVQTLLDTIYPDMGYFSNTIGYGYTYGFTDILSPLETSYVLVASLIASDTPRQINWHLDGARRNGATLEEVKAVRQIAIEAASAAGVKWKDVVPEVKDS